MFCASDEDSLYLGCLVGDVVTGVAVEVKAGVLLGLGVDWHNCVVFVVGV